MPNLITASRAGILLFTDEDLFHATGVRMAFTGRDGGCSTGSYASLNLGANVDDDPVAIACNRESLLCALGASKARLIVPNQVHGTELVCLDNMDAALWEQRCEQARAGADGIIVNCENTAALLCFADCMPVILVAPGGAFAVVHAGWRGVYGNIASKALDLLSNRSGVQAESCNAYVGPYIHAECFEVDVQLAQKFATAFGDTCLADNRHVDLGAAMRTSLIRAGMNPVRIADAGICTVCNNERFFSYRAQGGICGRHAAIAVRMER